MLGPSSGLSPGYPNERSKHVLSEPRGQPKFGTDQRVKHTERGLTWWAVSTGTRYSTSGSTS